MRLGLCLLVLSSLACGPATPSEREPGVRAPLSAPCDVLDETRCLLPWPSSTFTVSDPNSLTGLRISLKPSSLPVTDSPASLNRQDGFSVATPLVVGFPTAIAPGLAGSRESSAVRLFSSQPGASFAREVPVRLHLVADKASPASALVAWPQRPLRYGTDYVAVVLDEVLPEGEGRFEAPRAVQVAAGLVEPLDDGERRLFAYHAPARQVLARAGIDPGRVLRLWDFTTRSAQSHRAPLDAMRARAVEAPLEIRVTGATLRDGGVEVRGVVAGLVRFVNDAGELSVDGAGVPQAVGTQEAPFRAVLPAGEGPLPMVLFGHGTGSDVSDPDLDDDFLATGAGKLNLEFEGWTKAEIASTFAGFLRPIFGAERSTARLAQSLVNASALEVSLGAALGAALTAPQLGGKSNPAAGRPLDLEHLAWFGSSLGGTLGYAHAQFEPSIGAAVLNVPGAGCAQFLLLAEQWVQLDQVFALTAPSTIDRALAVSMAQSNWDLVDGAAWAAHGVTRKPLLIQESVGDEVLPNVGTELVAASAEAVQLSRVIVPVLGVERVDSAQGRPSLTQFRLPAVITDSGEVHAFVTKDTQAGKAAREQLRAFLTSFWAGSPTAQEPPLCAARGELGCDFQ